MLRGAAAAIPQNRLAQLNHGRLIPVYQAADQTSRMIWLIPLSPGL